MTEDRVWSHETDDILAEHRQMGMVVHRPSAADSVEPACRKPGEYFRYGAWVVRMEVGHPCRACWPHGMPR